MLEKILKEKGLFQYFENIEDKELKKELLQKSSVKRYNKGDIVFFNQKDNITYYFLNGKYQIRDFITSSIDYVHHQYGEFWLGTAAALGEEIPELEITFIEETDLICMPLKDLLYTDPSKNIDLWIRIAKLMTEKLVTTFKKSGRILVLPVEVYFLRCLVENGYIFKGFSVRDVALLIGINTRTLQRIVKKYEIEGLIVREKDKKIIKASSKEVLDEFLKKYS